MNSPTRQAGLYAGLLMALALLAAACHGGSGSPGVAGAGSSTPPGLSSSSSSRSDQLLAFSRCMRSRGVPQFPDPEPGQDEIKLPPANQPGWGAASGSRFWSAASACRRLLPPGVGAWYPRSEIPWVLRGLRKFAECMRNHGILNWPDPRFDSQGRLGFTGPGADNPPGSPTDHAVKRCSYLLPSEVTDLLGVG